LRTYCIGRPSRSAIHAAYGIPAVSPPGHDVELLEACVPGERRDREFAELAADSRIEDQLAAIDVDRARPARREDEGLVGGEQHRLDFEQHAGGGTGDEGAVGRVHPGGASKSGADSISPGSVNAAAPGTLQCADASMRGDVMDRIAPCAGLVAAVLIALPLRGKCTVDLSLHGHDGKKYYGAAIPNQCIGQSVEELDKNGNLVRRIENRSAEDKAAKKAEEKKKAEEAAVKKEEDRRNRALLATYSSEKDIEEARGRALADNQVAITDTTRRIEEIKKRQAQLNTEMEFYKKNPAPVKLQNDVKAAQTDLEAQQNLLDDQEEGSRSDQRALRRRQETLRGADRTRQEITLRWRRAPSARACAAGSR
jgi:hypothetical protein